MTDGIGLKTLLEITSYNILVIAIGFSFASAIIYQADPDVGQAMGLTVGILILLSTATHRLANH